MVVNHALVKVTKKRIALDKHARDVPGWVRTLKTGLDLEPFLMFAPGKNAPSNAPWMQLAQCGLGTMKMQEGMPSDVLL